MGFLDFLFKEKAPSTKTVSGWNKDQQEMASGLMDYYTPRVGQYQGSLDTVMSGRPSTDINQYATENYYRNAIEAPARQQYRDQVAPAVRERYGNFWSTARMNAEGRAQTDLENQLANQRANLYYQDEQARRALNESALARILEGYKYSPEAMAQQMLGVTPQNQVTYGGGSLFSNVVSPIASIASLFAK